MPFLVTASQRERREGNNYINKERQREEEGEWKGGVPLHENAAGMWMFSACVWMDTMFHPLFRRRQRSAGERQHSNEKADERINSWLETKSERIASDHAQCATRLPLMLFFLFRFPPQCSLVFNRSALGCSVYNLQKKNNNADVTRAVFSQGH